MQRLDHALVIVVIMFCGLAVCKDPANQGVVAVGSAMMGIGCGMAIFSLRK